MFAPFDSAGRGGCVLKFDSVPCRDLNSVGSIDRGIDVPGGGRKRAGTVILITFHANALERYACLRVSTSANLERRRPVSGPATVVQRLRLRQKSST